MIKITVTKDEDKYNHIIVTGHAGYDKYGKDIVCSAVSSIVTTSVNASLLLYPNSLTCNSKTGHVEISNIKDKKEVQLLLDNMLNLLTELKDEYPKYITIID